MDKTYDFIQKKIEEMKLDRPTPCWFILPRTDWPESLKRNFSESLNSVPGIDEDFAGTTGGQMMSEETADILFNHAVMENIDEVLGYYQDVFNFSEDKEAGTIPGFIKFIEGMRADCRDGGCEPAPECDSGEYDPLSNVLLNSYPTNWDQVITDLEEMAGKNYLHGNDYLFLDMVYGQIPESDNLVKEIIEKRCRMSMEHSENV